MGALASWSPADRNQSLSHAAGVIEAARIGPNAVLQTRRALAEQVTPEVVAAVEARALVPAELPPGMIPETWFLQLIRAVRAELPADRAEAVLRQSGAGTAAYVSTNRIPAVIRGVLRVLPTRVALSLLLKAISQHAWTFAGAGRFSVEGRYPFLLRLDDCPTCRPETALGATRSGAWYEAAFEGLLRLAAPRVSVHEVECRAAGATTCRFRLALDRSPSCASS